MANTREIALWKGQDKIIFPVNPKTISISCPQTNKKMNLLIGEYITMGPPGLITTNISTFLPADGSYYAGKIPQKKAISLLKSWKNTGAEVWLSISGLLNKTAFHITALELSGNEGDRDVDVRISLSETRKLTKTKAEKRAAAPAPAKTATKAGRKYVVKRGDNLHKIARAFYNGAGAKWKDIYNANRKTIGSNPNLIFPGQKLTIP